MTVERSGHGALITNADYSNNFEYKIYNNISTSNQWTILDNYTIYSYATGDGSYAPERRFLEYVIFNGYSGLNYDLEYSIVVREFNSSTVIFESGWVPNNTACQCYGIWSQDRRRPAVYIYVRRNEFDDNGNRRYLVPSDMRPSFFRQVYSVRETITQTTAIPQDWLTGTAGTFTTDFSTMTTVVPTVCDIDDTEFNAFIDIPNKIVAGINLCIVGIGSLLNLKYVTFMICFVLIVGLIAWLIH